MNANSQWFFAVIASIVLHVVILAAAVGWHLRSEKSEGPNAPAVEAPPAEMQAEEPKSDPFAVKPTAETMRSKEHEKPSVSMLGSEEDSTGFSAPRSSASAPREVTQTQMTAKTEPDPEKAEPKERKPEKVAAKEQKTVKAEPKETKPSRGHKIITYVVKRGDSLTSVAKDFDCTPAELAKINGKPYKAFAKLYVGQKIKVKAKEE